MNGNHSFPPISKLGPLIFVGLIIWAVKEAFFSAETTEKKPENAPAAPQPEIFRPTVSAENRPSNRDIPPYSAGKSTSPSPPSVPPPAPVPAYSIPSAKIAPSSTTVARHHSITRADMAKVFGGGIRGLTRKKAVCELTAMGFGKTAAYEALLAHGRFANWLQVAPDGIIIWKG